MMKLLASLVLLSVVAFAEEQDPYSCREGEGGADACGEDEEYALFEPKVPEDATGVNSAGSGADDDAVTSATASVQGLEVVDGVDLLQTTDLGLCRDLNNLALTAFPSGSGGGVTTYGPSNMNDGATCQFYWPLGNSATIQYRWRQAVSIEHFVIMTDPACSGAACGAHGDGRGIGSGTVQYWNGATWVTDGSFTNTGRYISYAFRSCISTVAIRVIDVTTHNCGQQSNPVVYEWSVCECEQQLRMCGNATNLAPFAIASGSGGGVGTYGVSNLNDLDECQWYWPSGNSEWIQYKWNTPVYVNRFLILTDPECAVNSMCASFPNLGRGVATGTVSYLDASNTWVVDGSFTSKEAVLEYELRKCVEITALRVTGISTHNCGQQSNPVIYEWSACCCEPDDCCC